MTFEHVANRGIVVNRTRVMRNQPRLPVRAMVGQAILLAGSLMFAQPCVAAQAPGAPDLPLRYLNPPGLERGLNSLAVSEKLWIPSVKFRAVPVVSTGDFAAQMASALAALDADLRTHMARRHAIVRLDVIYRTGEAGAAGKIDDALRSYFKSRIGSMEGEDGGIDYPVRSEIGKRDIGAGAASVVLEGEFVDRENIDITYLVDPEVRKQAEIGSLVLFGGIGPQTMPASKASLPADRVDSCLQSLASVLATAGMTYENVKQLKVYVASASAAETSGWETVFGEALHRRAIPVTSTVEYIPVAVAGLPGQPFMLAGSARRELPKLAGGDKAASPNALAAPQ